MTEDSKERVDHERLQTRRHMHSMSADCRRRSGEFRNFLRAGTSEEESKVSEEKFLHQITQRLLPTSGSH
jgi:hypothetical protein